MNRRITVLPDLISLTVADGANLLEVLRREGLSLNAVCGGNGTCGKCLVSVNGERVLACQTTVDSDMVVQLPQSAGAEILTSGHSASVRMNPIRSGYLIAFDIGTTTVVCYLLSPAGQEMAVQSMLNPQCAYGADVISRIQRALSGDLERLTASIRSAMSSMIEGCCRSAGVNPEEIGVVSIVGNPCMQQLFLGLSPKNLAKPPFAPILVKPDVVSAGEYLLICPNAKLLIVPDISGYVGADTVGCVLSTDLLHSGKTALLVDIGTNGEMVLTHQGRAIACSTAAGPALEGAGIQFGMRGVSGAIDHVWTEHGTILCSTIGAVESQGICGSGLIDAVAVLLELGLINARGRIQSADEVNGHRIVRLTEQVYLTQEDIRAVQMAKGAIAAGIVLMAAHLGISVSQIECVYLAGAFGNFLNPENACRIGLLPPELRGKTVPVGNAAGSGAKMMACNQAVFQAAGEAVEHIDFLELASLPTFQRVFASQMRFSL